MEFECRTCLKVSANVRNIFSNDLPFKIESILSVEILEDDRFPSTICEECVGKLTQMYDFCQVIRTSNVILMSRCIKEEAVTTTETYQNQDEEINLQFKQERIFEDFAVETPELESENNGIYMCILCDFSSSEYGLWKCHQEKHKKVRRQPKKQSLTHTGFSVKCLMCDRMFKHEKSLRSHLSTHDENVSYSCTICGKVYRYSLGYYHHAKLHASKWLGKTVECATCGKLFLKKKMLVSHIYSHTGERPFPCRYCDRGFGSNNQRNTHESFDCIHVYSEELRLNNT